MALARGTNGACVRWTKGPKQGGQKEPVQREKWGLNSGHKRGESNRDKWRLSKGDKRGLSKKWTNQV